MKIIFLNLVLYLLVLLQASFLPHFDIFGYTPNLIYILAVLSFFLIPSLDLTFVIAGGFLLDVFSGHFFGFNVLMLLGMLFFVKLVVKKHVQISVR